MKKATLTRSLLAASIALASISTQAADMRVNGFISIGAGKTLNEGRDTTTGKKATVTADSPTDGIYDDNIDFKPDSIYGIQISSNLGEGLSVTGQITGAGGEDFEAKIAWAYISYALNDEWTVNAGRQRLPFFFYSDFLDVGYAYHWMRPPTETQVAIDTLDGVQFTWQGATGDWDSRVQLYAGTSEASTEATGTLGLDNAMGAVFYTSNDWLQLRATYMVSEFWVNDLSSTSTAALAGLAPTDTKFGSIAAQGQDKDNAVDAWFGGLAAHATFGNTFVVAEYVTYEFDDPILTLGWTQYESAYISLGHRIKDFTPHITFSAEKQDVENAGSTPGTFLTDSAEKSEAVTVGVRWDFHPSAAFKVEYSTRSDKSDDDFEATRGDRNDIDLISAGVDVIF